MRLCEGGMSDSSKIFVSEYCTCAVHLPRPQCRRAVCQPRTVASSRTGQYTYSRGGSRLRRRPRLSLGRVPSFFITPKARTPPHFDNCSARFRALSLASSCSFLSFGFLPSTRCSSLNSSHHSSFSRSTSCFDLNPVPNHRLMPAEPCQHANGAVHKDETDSARSRDKAHAPA